MKEKYERPEIAFISFELSQNIASGCATKATHADYSCPVTVTDSTGDTDVIFTSGSSCTLTPPNPDDYVCYHVPNDYNGIHSS